MANDQYAEIAAGGIGGRMNFLEVPQPVHYEVQKCMLKMHPDDNMAPLVTEQKISTKEKLYEKLQTLRTQYQPYLEEYAPQLKACTKITKLTDFILNGTEKITLPHYGSPIGCAVATYETDFEVGELTEEQAVFIRFKGADYIAFVYVNGECVGRHEGFFAPFEFEISGQVKPGTNHLKVVLKNDYRYMGNEDDNGGVRLEGDKLYAATGLGWDDPDTGWHHCPPGMGIYHDVTVEVRNTIHVTDLFVREGKEAWIEIQNTKYEARDITIKLSVYGLNFKETVFEDVLYIPSTARMVGLGDSLTAAEMKDKLAKPMPLPLKHGNNVYKIPISIENPRLWSLEQPYLYQIQVTVLCNGKICDTAKAQFGIRSFHQDLDSEIKGMFYLNGKKIRLRGANTMGYEQQDVMRQDWEQLIDDILLAKLCNMNFLRLAQRPVQDEVYQYCDKLGLMTQTDLPLFGCMRRNQFCEGVRQAEEMERLVRNHACNVMISYINEPHPNAYNQPHRNLEREEMERFFAACDLVVKMNNPDRVIKHVDGDYDPPSDDMPDSHCYPLWYNGHGIDIGKMNKGYWLPVKPGWFYGCGEFGTEGLDCIEVMKRDYPKEWITEPFHPNHIVKAQTGRFHYFFYDTPDSLEEWADASQKHQAYATAFMTEAFRRDSRMVSTAIHHFIDAWPGGWMKAIMDWKRNPKAAYFAYRDALEPFHVSLRTDRYTYFAGEEIAVEVFVCNDTDYEGNCMVTYELYDQQEKLVAKSQVVAKAICCDVSRADDAVFVIHEVNDREKFTLKVILCDESGKVVDYNQIGLEVFEDCKIIPNEEVVLIEKLTPGKYEIAGELVEVKKCSMLPLHFVSRKTGHESVACFEQEDFKNWYNASEDMITPLLENTFTASGFTPILISGNLDEQEEWNVALAVAEKWYQGKRYVICQVDLRQENPVAKRFLSKILERKHVEEGG